MRAAQNTITSAGTGASLHAFPGGGGPAPAPKVLILNEDGAGGLALQMIEQSGCVRDARLGAQAAADLRRALACFSPFLLKGQPS